MKPKFPVVALTATKQNERVLSIASQCNEVLSSTGVKVLIDKNLSKLKSNDLGVSSFEKIILESSLMFAKWFSATKNIYVFFSSFLIISLARFVR